LWRGLVGPYEFRPDELPLVVEACRLVDDIEKIRSALVDEPLLVAGSKGQPTVNPLRTELHRTSARLESICRTLGVPDEAELSDEQRATWAGRNLARQRWS
jgi:hypothetical protein